MSRGLHFASVNDMPEGMRKMVEQANQRRDAAPATHSRAGTVLVHNAPAIIANRALGRLPTGTMNKTEAAYAQELEFQKRAGLISWYRFEGAKLRLADKTFLTVDFAVMLANGQLEMRDVKGGPIEDDAAVKMKVAASMYPFCFKIIRRIPKKLGGGWSEKEVSSGL